MKRLPYVVYSSDSHIIEPPDLWTKRIDKEWRELAPRIVSLEDTDIWVVDKDTRFAVVGIQDQAGYRFEDPSKITKKGRMDQLATGSGGWEPDAYCEGLAHDGVAGALVYPSNAVQAFRCIDGPLLYNMAKTYNDWVITEFCAPRKKQLKAAAMITVDDPQLAITEMRRCAKLGAAALMLPTLPVYPKTYDQPEFEPMWAAAEEIGLPLVMHFGSTQRGRDREPPLDLILHATRDVQVQRTLTTLFLSGLFVKHPKLRLGVVEFGASWLPPLMQIIDRLYKENIDALPLRYPDGELPSDHLRRNMFASFQDDQGAIAMRDYLGVENLQWGNDYPHAESTYPKSQEFLERQFVGLSQADAAAIAGINSAKAYGFELPA